MMKKYIFIFIILPVLVSCNDFLEETPKTQVSIETSFDTYDKAIKTISSLYADLEEIAFSDERFMMPSIIKMGNEESKKFNWNSSSSSIKNLYDDCYSYIAQCNIVIQALSNEVNKSNIDNTFSSSTQETETMKANCSTNASFSATNMLLGEARFLRAYAYFTLYRYFGGISLITEPTGSIPKYVPRADRETVFNFIDEELNLAITNCLSNTSGLANGRITKGAAAGLLAKSYVFHASYIKRAEKYGDAIDEDKEGDKSGLYAKALKLCNDIIDGVYGNYKLVDFYPAIFTKTNQETMFTVYAQEGVGTGSKIPIGFPGNSSHGATGGPNLEEHLAVLYDLPIWEYGDRFKTLYKTFGQSDVYNNDINSVSSDSLIKLMNSRGDCSFTGDSIRRLWNTVRAVVSGPKDGLEAGVWVFDPIYGKKLGEGFFIEPGKGENYTSVENDLINNLLEVHERLWWRNLTSKDMSCWNVNWECLGKFRNPNPQDLSSTFSAKYSGVAYPILRLAEIYLLKAETQLSTNDKIGAINTLNIIRNRACNKSTLRDMFLNQGDASYTYIPNSVMQIPTTLSDYQALKELMYERLRELCCEDDCEWFDASRYPDIFIEDLDDISRYSNPIRGGFSFNDPDQGYHGFLGFNADKIYRVLLPIPSSEFTFFPEMKQNPVY